jgi:ABC-2 type transport system permease protein
MNTIYILWLRQIKRFLRSGIRIVMGFVQPLIYMLALGYGLNAVFQQSGKGSYIQFIVPGIIVQTIMFTSMFWGANIIWDKQFGFLKEMLVAPVSRTKIMFGSVLGGATISLVQGIILFIIALLLGFHPVNWAYLPLTVLFMGMLALAVIGFSAGIGAVVNDMQAFVAVNNFLLIPLFFLSSALFPLDSVPTAMKIIASFNPISYAVDAIRFTLINQSHFGLPMDFAVLTVTVILLMTFGSYRFRQIQA